eukprot:TRINITY_DN28727_c0_g2_i1.p2 TRINITY_DN28727_c0_g2~~TRINITY_DN28727_c0_g2_i1.p2  ORF type:complete len:260 (-),score=24.86 TRINITY_DN28727_c0_g2_i1:10-789(-)
MVEQSGHGNTLFLTPREGMEPISDEFPVGPVLTYFAGRIDDLQQFVEIFVGDSQFLHFFNRVRIDDLVSKTSQHEVRLLRNEQNIAFQELWPARSTDGKRGKLTKPLKRDILFVPQKPYLVLGSLRDQIIYPHSVEEMKKLGVTDEDLDKLLKIVDPAGKIRENWPNWEFVTDWFHAFSGGQKQRIAMARLFYHRPKFAILDECTSAVSDEVEDKIYESCKALGITLLTVSHREYLKKHHEAVLRIEGRKGEWVWIPLK